MVPSVAGRFTWVASFSTAAFSFASSLVTTGLIASPPVRPCQIRRRGQAAARARGGHGGVQVHGQAGVGRVHLELGLARLQRDRLRDLVLETGLQLRLGVLLGQTTDRDSENGGVTGDLVAGERERRAVPHHEHTERRGGNDPRELLSPHRKESSCSKPWTGCTSGHGPGHKGTSYGTGQAPLDRWGRPGLPDMPRRSRSGVGQIPVVTGVVDQRAGIGRLARAEAEHLADHDRVVAPVVRRPGPALEPGQRAVDQRTPGLRAGRRTDAVELAVAGRAPTGRTGPRSTAGPRPGPRSPSSHSPVRRRASGHPCRRRRAPAADPATPR